MNLMISKTLGGLGNQYHLRQFLFGLIFPILLYFMFSHEKIDEEISVSMMSFAIVSTLLYPYSRFVYEKLVGFIFGENVFIVNAIFLLMVKLITMWLCWGFAIFIAPIGLGYLYFYHTKNSANTRNQPDA